MWGRNLVLRLVHRLIVHSLLRSLLCLVLHVLFRSNKFLVLLEKPFLEFVVGLRMLTHQRTLLQFLLLSLHVQNLVCKDLLLLQMRILRAVGLNLSSEELVARQLV